MCPLIRENMVEIKPLRYKLPKVLLQHNRWPSNVSADKVETTAKETQEGCVFQFDD